MEKKSKRYRSALQAADLTKEYPLKDAVEILAGAGYLIAEFLSTATNRRTDQYGGSLENRARFGVEVIRKVRAAIGDKVALLIRVAGHDFFNIRIFEF